MAAVFFLWDALFTWPAGKFVGGDEIASMFLPWQTFILDSLRQYGALPLWNPYLFAGVPFAANPQPMMFYPFTYLGLLMPVTRAMALTLAIHIWLGGMGMYGWLRSLKASHAGALLAGFAYAFTGPFVLRVGVGHYGLALQLAWWPLSFWALQTALSKRSWRWAILTGVPMALALLSGHTATCLLLFVALGAYTVYEAGVAYKDTGRWSSGARGVGLAGAAVIMSAALAAVQYLPLITFSQLSVRAAAPSADFSSRFSLPIGQLVTLFVPNFFGEVIRLGYWGAEGYEEITYYVGLLVVLLAVTGAWSVRSRRVLFFLALALGALLLQLGPDGVVFQFFYRFVPGFAATRAPGRAGLIYAFSLVTVAGLVWSELERAPQETVQRWLSLFDRRLVWTVSTLTTGAILLAFIFYAAFKTNGTTWTWNLGGQLTQFLVLFWAAMALFAGLKNRSVPPRAINALAIALVIFDLWSYGLKSIQPGVDPLVPAWPGIASLVQDQSEYRIAPEDLEFFQLNGALAYRIRSHYGYDPLVLARYQTLLDSGADYFDPVYDLLNVKYVVARNPLPPGKSGATLQAVSETSNLKVYERPNPLPRAFIVHDAKIAPNDADALTSLHAAGFEVSRTVTLPAFPQCSLTPASQSVEETAHVMGESPNHLELATHSASAGLLVLSEVYYPGWQASVDGQPAQLLRADTALRAVCLPAGSHTVSFDFRPHDLTIGAIISCLALVMVVATAAGEWFSTRRRSG